jgi:hypothetical protein
VNIRADGGGADVKVRATWAAAAVGLTALAGGSGAAGLTAGAERAGPAVRVELNKLESAGKSCRGYFVARNETSEAIASMRLDVFLFDPAGVIIRRVALTFGDLRPERTRVALFELAEVPCEEIGRLLVNDVLGCVGAGGAPIATCPEMIRATSRTAIAFDA